MQSQSNGKGRNASFGISTHGSHIVELRTAVRQVDKDRLRLEPQRNGCLTIEFGA